MALASTKKVDACITLKPVSWGEEVVKREYVTEVSTEASDGFI